ncbi:MAG: hypothetical protein AAGG61_06095, partial [Methanothrix soehngenii]
MKNILAISMAIMIAAIVMMPALGYSEEMAENPSYTVASAGNQSYSAGSAGSQSYTATSAGVLSNTAANAGRKGFSFSTGVAAHNLTSDMVTEVNSVSASPELGIRIPYSIKDGSMVPYSIQQGFIVPYSPKLGSIVPYSIQMGSYASYSIKLMDETNATLRGTYQTVKLEPTKLGSIARKEAVALAGETPSVAAVETPEVQEVALNETA